MYKNKGAALAEYGLLVGLIGAMAIGAVSALGKWVDFEAAIAAFNVHTVYGDETNLLVNGDFDDPTGMIETGWGYAGSSIEGWTSLNGENFELHESGWQGIDSINGGYWLDTNASPGRLDISQQVTDLEPRSVYQVTLWAGDRDSDLDGSADVYWGDEKIGTLDPTVEDEMQSFVFHVREGDGDGSNTIRIVDTGDIDSNGLSLDEVRIWGI